MPTPRAKADNPLATADAAEILREEACSAIPRGYSDWARCHQLDTRLYTRPQRLALESDADRLVVWGANRIGKTLLLVDDAVLYVVGRHPRQRHECPVKVGLGGKSWVQMASTLKQLWATVDPRWFKRAIRYEGGQLKGQRYAIYDIESGPGKGGQLYLATDEQGADAVQGWEVHRWDQDEPLSQSFYGELIPRLLTTGGALRLVFTCRLGSAGESGEKQRWFWELVDGGEIDQIQVPLTLDAVTPRGGLIEVPYLSRGAIEAFERSLPGPEREMRMGRSRVPIFADRVFTGWDDSMVDDEEAPEGIPLIVGVDHGSGAGRQRACILAARLKPEPEVWLLDEAASDGRTTPEEDAKAIADTLVRLTGIRNYAGALAAVDVWVGDRRHAGDSLGGEKSNYHLQTAFCRLLGYLPAAKQAHGAVRNAMRLLPEPLREMRHPTKWEGSVLDNARDINEIMLKRRFHASRRVPVTVQGIQNWRGHQEDPEKDACDAMRYGIIGAFESHKLLRMTG